MAFFLGNKDQNIRIRYGGETKTSSGEVDNR